MSTAQRQPAVWVLGDSDRATLAIIRSLGRRGIPVDLGTWEARSVCAASRYVRNVMHLPDPTSDAQSLRDAIAEHIDAVSYGMTVPAEDTFITALMPVRAAMASRNVLLPPHEQFSLAFNKAETVVLAQQLSVPVPLTRAVHSAAELDEAFAGLATPVVVKSAFSCWEQDGRLSKHSTTFHDTYPSA